jgi:hypothetical protein
LIQINAARRRRLLHTLMAMSETKLTETAQDCFRDSEICPDPQLAHNLREIGQHYLALAADLRRARNTGRQLH